MSEYNHKSIEQKWRKNWEIKPINLNDGKKDKYYCQQPSNSKRYRKWGLLFVPNYVITRCGSF